MSNQNNYKLTRSFIKKLHNVKQIFHRTNIVKKICLKVLTKNNFFLNINCTKYFTAWNLNSLK